MAHRIEGPYDFSDYNFATYSDGATWELSSGEDFTVQPQTVVNNARAWARREGLEVETKVKIGTPQTPAVVAVRFRKPQQLRAV